MASSSSSSSPELTHASAISSSFFKYASLVDVLEELSTRFIMNLPDQELASVERLCFQVEQAHWYYDDFMREENPKLPNLPLKRFSQLFFDSCPLLRQWNSDHEVLFQTFMQYKTRVPVCGAIMLNDKWDKCLLVKGWKSSAGWGFPKGKINQREELHRCAIREVQEETGFNLEKYIKPEHYLEMTIREQSVTLFVVGGIPEDYPFQTRTRKEISKIEWFKLSDLPSCKRNNKQSSKFYLITPFLTPLNQFIRVNGPKRRQEYKKTGAETAANLSIQTKFNIHQSENAEGLAKDIAESAVDFEREAHASSSSSADNYEPHTPSPQSAGSQLMPSKQHLSDDEHEQHMDPHLVRLLNGLSLSAQQQRLLAPKEKIAGQTFVVMSEVAPKNGTDPIAAEKCNEEATCPEVNRVTDDPLRMCMPKQFSLDGIPQSPISSADSTGSATTAKAHTSNDSASSTNRHIKHVALLESLATESVPVPWSSSSSRPVLHPGSPSSVPPVLARSANEPREGRYRLPSNQSGYPVPHHGSGYLKPSFDSPFAMRPTTSHALFSPSVMSQRRQGQALSMHQGSLLTILKGSGSAAHAASAQGGVHAPVGNSSAAVNTVLASNFPSSQSGISQLPNALPASCGIFPFRRHVSNEGSASSGILGLSSNQTNTQASSKANLLSILNPISIAKPASTFPVVTRHSDYCPGNPYSSSHSHGPYPDLSQSSTHR